MNQNSLDDGVPPVTPIETKSRAPTIVAVILGIALLASNMAWAAVLALSQTAKPESTSKSQLNSSSDNSSNTSGAKTRSIPEISAYYTLDTDTSKLTYAYTHDSSGTYIGFSTIDLTDHNIKRPLTTYDCNSNNGPLGKLQILQPTQTYNGQSVADLVAAGKAKQLKSTYVMYLPPQGNCSDDATVNAIQASGVAIAQRAVNSLKAQ